MNLDIHSIQHQKLHQKELHNTKKPVVKVYSLATFIYGATFPITFPISKNFNILLQTVFFFVFFYRYDQLLKGMDNGIVQKS